MYTTMMVATTWTPTLLAAVYYTTGFVLFYHVVRKYDIAWYHIAVIAVAFLLFNLAHIEWTHR